MAPEYAVRLASSLYMDSNGTFSNSPPAGVPTLPSASFNLPVDPAKVKDVLNSIADGVKSATDPTKQTSLLLRRLGVTGELLNAFKDFGELAANLAKFVPYVSAAVELLKVFNILGNGEDKVAPALQQRFQQINALIIAFNQQWKDIVAADYQNPVLTQLDSVRVHVQQMRTYDDLPPAAADWITIDNSRNAYLIDRHEEALNALKGFLNPALWQSNYTGRDPDDPSRGWDPLRPLFNLVLPDDAGNWNPAPPEHAGIVSRFDHRVMVHLVPGLIHCYLSAIKLLLPEYRSTGRFRPHLLALAQGIEVLMKKTLQENLARTRFTSADLLNPAWLPGTGFGPGPQPQPRFDVGAYDLAAAKTLPPGITQWPPTGWWDDSDKVINVGAMTFNWPPPTKYQWGGARDGQGWYRWDLLNTAECVNALNAESEVRYGTLLYSSGYMQLAQTAALLRHLCVAPDKSETVMGGFRTARTPGTPGPIQVTSKKVFPFEPISTQAQRIDQTFVVTARLLLQSPLHCTTDPVLYRVYLRTLSARRLDARSDYSSHYWTSRTSSSPSSYETLTCSYTGGELDQKRLLEARTERAVRTEPRREISLQADVFDLWVPVPDGPLPAGLLTDVFTGIEKSMVATTAAGSNTPSRFVSTVDQLVSEWIASGGGSEADRPRVTPPAARELGESKVAETEGQRRHLDRGSVSLAYEWTWNGPLLEIKIEAPATNRNADVYLVVEEQIVDRQWRHSSFLIPLTTQLTYVPQSFLDEEAGLAQKANRFWRELLLKYAESVAVGPEDPIARLGRMSLRSVDQRLTVEAVVREHAPELLAAHFRAYGLPNR